jgi:hypothetical protein
MNRRESNTLHQSGCLMVALYWLLFNLSESDWDND